MGQTCQDDTIAAHFRPGEPGLTTRMVENGIQQQHKSRITTLNLVFSIQKGMISDAQIGSSIGKSDHSCILIRVPKKVNQYIQFYYDNGDCKAMCCEHEIINWKEFRQGKHNHNCMFAKNDLSRQLLNKKTIPLNIFTYKTERERAHAVGCGQFA